MGHMYLISGNLWRNCQCSVNINIDWVLINYILQVNLRPFLFRSNVSSSWMKIPPRIQDSFRSSCVPTVPYYVFLSEPLRLKHSNQFLSRRNIYIGCICEPIPTIRWLSQTKRNTSSRPTDGDEPTLREVGISFRGIHYYSRSNTINVSFLSLSCSLKKLG